MEQVPSIYNYTHFLHLAMLSPYKRRYDFMHHAKLGQEVVLRRDAHTEAHKMCREGADMG